MNQEPIGLSAQTLFGDGARAQQQTADFVRRLFNILHAGDGRKPQATRDIAADVPLRLFVGGLDHDELTPAMRRMVEAYAKLRLRAGLPNNAWIANPRWAPQNPAGAADTERIGEASLDVEWMLSLGVPRPIWEKHVLMNSTALSGQPPSSHHQAERYFVLLAAYGFDDPSHFFKTSNPKT